MYEIEEIQGFDFTWPYITYKGLHKYQYIFNANERNIIHRVELPRDVVAVKKSFITELLDLFIVVETKHEYILFKIDLDRFKDTINKTGQIFEREEMLRFSK